MRLAAEGAGRLPVVTHAPLGFSPLGNYVPPPRFTASRHVGVTFFECSRFSPKDLETLKTFDLVVSGSRWNQALLQRQGVQRARLVHRGWIRLCSTLSPCHDCSIAVW